MVIIEKEKCTYYVQESQVILEYNKQFTSFNVFNLQSRKRFKDFKLELMQSKREDYSDFPEAYSLARKHGLTGMVGFKPNTTNEDTRII